MDKEKELVKLDKVVTATLEKHPETRNSDLTLYLRICTMINPTAMEQPFGYVMAHCRELGLPNYDSVGRARRKAQEEHAELQAVEPVHRQRQKNVEIFADYARGLLNEG